MPCSEEMIRDHTRQLANHAARVKELARAVSRVEQEISEVRSLAQELAGNGRIGAIDRLRETVLGLAQTVAGETATIDAKATSAHYRLDEMRDDLHSEFRQLRAFSRAVAVGAIVALLGTILQLLTRI